MDEKTFIIEVSENEKNEVIGGLVTVDDKTKKAVEEKPILREYQEYFIRYEVKNVTEGMLIQAENGATAIKKLMRLCLPDCEMILIDIRKL